MEEKKNGIISLMALLFLPPIISLPISFYCANICKQRLLSVYVFFAVLSLIFSYFSPIYDTIHNISFAQYFDFAYDSIFELKVAFMIIHTFEYITGLEGMNFFIILFWACLCLLFNSFKNYIGFDKHIFVISFGCVAIVSLISLSFFTFASILFIWIITNKFNNRILKIVLLLIFPTIFHKSIILVTLPGILLFLIRSEERKYLNCVLVALLVIFYIALFNNSLTTLLLQTDLVPGTEYMQYKADDYLGDGTWGSGNSFDSSMSRILQNLIQYSIQLLAIILFLIRKKNKFNLLESIFIVNIIIVISSLNLYVINQRFCISGVILSCLYIVKYCSDYNNSNTFNSKFIKRFKYIIILFYMISFHEIFTTAYRDPLIPKSTANEITNRLLYMPGILLLDISDFGFNDNIINQNKL